jgi:hypothetical protein
VSVLFEGTSLSGFVIEESKQEPNYETNDVLHNGDGDDA